MPAQLIPEATTLTKADEQLIKDLGLDSDPHQLQAFKDLKLVLSPSQPRTDLIEYLLEKIEPGFITSQQASVDHVACLK